MPRIVCIDPPSEHYFNDKLFDVSDSSLNRDGTLEAFHRLRVHAEARGTEIHTADLWTDCGSVHEAGDYYSLGVLRDGGRVHANGAFSKRAFIVFEPPVVAPHLYKALPELTRVFETVVIHNTHGDGYSLRGVDQSKLRKLYWPVPYNAPITEAWSRGDRLNRVVVINGNHNPRFRSRELYSTRIRAMVELAESGVVDLYGRGWRAWWSPKSMWPAYWFNRGSLMSIYRGACESKFDVLSRYRFCLCLENMAMDGYVTEKIFDCFYAGTIPLYLGAGDIADLIPPETFIDVRRFGSWTEMWETVRSLSDSEWRHMREAARDFLASERGDRYYSSLERIFGLK